MKCPKIDYIKKLYNVMIEYLIFYNKNNYLGRSQQNKALSVYRHIKINSILVDNTYKFHI